MAHFHFFLGQTRLVLIQRRKPFATIVAQTFVNEASGGYIPSGTLQFPVISAGKPTHYCLSGARWLWHCALGCCTERDMAWNALPSSTVHVALVSQRFPTLSSIVRFRYRTFRRSGGFALKSNWGSKDLLRAPGRRLRTCHIAFER